MSKLLDEIMLQPLVASMLPSNIPDIISNGMLNFWHKLNISLSEKIIS